MNNKTMYLMAFAIMVAGVLYYMTEENKIAERRRIETKQSIEAELVKTEKQNIYNECVLDAQLAYERTWLAECRRLEKEIVNKNCALPVYLGDRIEQSLKENKDRCVEMFK